MTSSVLPQATSSDDVTVMAAAAAGTQRTTLQCDAGRGCAMRSDTLTTQRLAAGKRKQVRSGETRTERRPAVRRRRHRSPQYSQSQVENGCATSPNCSVRSGHNDALTPSDDNDDDDAILTECCVLRHRRLAQVTTARAALPAPLDLFIFVAAAAAAVPARSSPGSGSSTHASRGRRRVINYSSAEAERTPRRCRALSTSQPRHRAIVQSVRTSVRLQR